MHIATEVCPMRRFAYICILPGMVAVACGPTGGDDDDDDDVVIDAPHVGPDGPAHVDAPWIEPADAPPVADGANVYGDADFYGDGGCASTECPSPVADGCGATEVCDDGLDNNCNGTIDELCACTPGAVQPCFLGPPGRRNVGACVDGTQRCQGTTEFGHWGACEGGMWPGGEACDTVDNNCNGCVDDHPDCCVVDLACPSPGDLPEASPFTDYTIDGTLFWGGPATSWTWTVVGGPCDQLLDATTGHVSYTLTGANTSTVTFRPTLSGDYTFTMTVQTPEGPQTCTFIVHVRGPGLRVELCWDTTGSTDIDLHTHRSGSTTPWFETSGGAINSDDCYYYNCKCYSYSFPIGDMAEWGYASSPIAECSGSPEGACWTGIGTCHNPRLDVDNIATVGIPENINVDRPVDGGTYRVMVHYYGGSGVTYPMVNVYCGGNLLGTYGAAPDTVPGFTSGAGFAAGTMWRVVDALTHVDAAGTTTGCDLSPLHPPGSPSGYWVTNNDTSY